MQSNVWRREFGIVSVDYLVRALPEAYSGLDSTGSCNGMLVHTMELGGKKERWRVGWEEKVEKSRIKSFQVERRLK